MSLATKIVGAVGAAFVAKWVMNGFTGEGISSMALQQGGLGLVMTTLIITAPPMAAAFFQGTLGQFTAYSALGQLDRAGQSPASGRPYEPGAPARDSTVGPTQTTTGNTTVMRNDSSPSQESNSGSRGLAQK